MKILRLNEDNILQKSKDEIIKHFNSCRQATYSCRVIKTTLNYESKHIAKHEFQDDCSDGAYSSSPEPFPGEEAGTAKDCML